MKPPLTPKLMLMSTSKLPLDSSNKLFGIVYITLPGVIDTIILTSDQWSCTDPMVSSAHSIPEKDRPAAQDWFPDTSAVSWPAFCTSSTS
ncbi:hypothetical protein DSO57_1019087 [Entomophthora muscae]|uniref:Uncharacterized protein n=1 Tax=Entomophthora muscae TaxID=34485 RepID=A0ACC2TEV4_9FUNG|nr:hypothetical protein DSO57_1019087 [Entomophthora muscae]